MKFTRLTGIKPSGVFHLGNYLSVIQPTLPYKDETIYLVADLHALTTLPKPKDIKQNTKEIIKILRSFNIHNIVLQSQVPEIYQLYTLLTAYTAKGILNRAHAYKVKAQDNIDKFKDQDKGINTLLYNYPVLMTADLVMFDTDYVTVGKDQEQHIEMAKEIVNKFNYVNKSDILRVPELVITEQSIEGYDGRKMSKSYNNIIPLMCSEKKLRKNISRIKTNEKNEGEPKYWNESPLCVLYDCFATKDEVGMLKQEMNNGLSWKYVKDEVFSVVNREIGEYRNVYDSFGGDLEFSMNRSILEYTREKFSNIKELIGLFPK